MLLVILNETFWSLGITAYYAVYARIGTEALAAVNIVSSIENMAFVLTFGLAHATAILVGNHIGAGDKERAYQYAGRSLALTTLIGVFIGSQVLLTTGSIAQISPWGDEKFRPSRLQFPLPT